MCKSIFFVLFMVVSSYSEPSFLPDNFQKCSINDSECLKQISESLIHYLADNGLPEMGIPKMDPMPIKNETVSVIGLVDITMVDGFGEGMKTCKLQSFDANMDTKITKFDMICDVVTVQGVYDIKSNAFIDRMLGNSVVGNGHGSVVMENLIMHFTIPFFVEKHDDGEIYLVPDFEKIDYTYEMDKATFTASSIIFGVLQIAQVVTTFLNRNWKYAMDSFGKLFSDRGIKIIWDYTKNISGLIPANKIILDDLTRYLDP